MGARDFRKKSDRYSPFKSSIYADCDGQAGLQELVGNATLLYYMTEEGREGKQAFLEKRPPNFRQYPWLP